MIMRIHYACGHVEDKQDRNGLKLVARGARQFMATVRFEEDCPSCRRGGSSSTGTTLTDE